MHKISFAQDLLQQIMTARRNHINAKINIYELELGPFFLPNDSTTLTNLLLYWILLLARPVFFFFLLNSLNLGGLTSNLTGTSKGTVDLTTKKWNVDINGHTIKEGNAHTILEQSSSTGQVQLLSRNTLQLGKLSTQSLNICLGGDLNDMSVL